MRRARLPWSAAIIAATLLAAQAPVWAAASSKDARRIYDEATAAFGLGRYAEAAEKYEAAFPLRPDPALLYNAAQSYRPGRQQGARARAVPQLRAPVPGRHQRGGRSHPRRRAEEGDRGGAATGAAAVAPAPPPRARRLRCRRPRRRRPRCRRPSRRRCRAAAPLPPAPPPAADPNVPMVSQPAATGDDEKSLTRQTWFWVAVGAAVVLVGTTVILLATRGETFPDATFGSARGN